jgi:hypothetical protein
MANDRWNEDTGRRERSNRRYHDRNFGQAGGYGQDNFGLNFEGADEAYGDRGPYRVPPSPAGGGYHHGAYAADQYHGRSEREPSVGADTFRGRRAYYDLRGEVTGSVFDYGEEPSPGHRGRGPRNYKRSDERIREDVSDNLMDSAELDATDIEVLVENGEVTLNGSVGDRHDKRLAEDLAEVRGVQHVQNNLRIQRSSSSTTPREFSR